MCLRRAPEKYIAGAAFDRAVLKYTLSPHPLYVTDGPWKQSDNHTSRDIPRFVIGRLAAMLRIGAAGHACGARANGNEGVGPACQSRGLPDLGSAQSRECARVLQLSSYHH
jgi:hypothetical protein